MEWLIIHTVLSPFVKGHVVPYHRRLFLVRHQKRNCATYCGESASVKARRNVIVGAAVSLVCMCGIAASGSLTKPLTGDYAIATTNVDPGPDDPIDSHLIVYLRGESAQSLYKAMKVAPKTNDACSGPGVQVKTIGGMSCSYTPKDKSYSCGFAIEIAKQKLEHLPC